MLFEHRYIFRERVGCACSNDNNWSDGQYGSGRMRHSRASTDRMPYAYAGMCDGKEAGHGISSGIRSALQRCQGTHRMPHRGACRRARTRQPPGGQGIAAASDGHRFGRGGNGRARPAHGERLALGGRRRAGPRLRLPGDRGARKPATACRCRVVHTPRRGICSECRALIERRVRKEPQCSPQAIAAGPHPALALGAGPKT